ncbi:hypothetical protein [Sanguibacter gelidistatuariae]|uniref:hypothetical protein n=1 Tax=Sanguibacter gelidistatuariae TaxID=1814289 RepID=UPI001C316A9F|nr:hypothetical protein [Sanguibacter gelidistatuariae]
MSSPAPTTTAATEAPPEPTADPTTDGPQVIDAGAVTVETPQTVTGTGPATIEFSVGKMNPVFEFTCADCADAVDVTLADPNVIMWRTTGPVDGAWLSRPFGAMPASNTISVEVNGTWSMTISDASTLPTSSGPQSGHGPAVITLDQPATQLEVTFTPLDETDILDIYVYGTTTDRESLRDFMTESTTETFDVALPGTVMILAAGDWTITPR